MGCFSQKKDSAHFSVDPDRFTFTTLYDQLNEPIEMDFLPDGNMLLIERGGVLKIFDSSKKKTHIAGELAVLYETETGLLGLAVDPSFSKNNWIYLFYTDPVNKGFQNISRFVLRDQQLDKASEKVILKIPIDWNTCCHMGGSLEFGPKGNLFISTGDNTIPTNYAFDERPDRILYDAQRSSANTLDLRGKILRIRPTAEGSYTIPDGNLFSPTDTMARPEIYVMGARNPFRIEIDQVTGWLFWGDVGPNPGSFDPARGPNTFDEFNLAKTAGNYGWPHFLADNKAFKNFDFATEQQQDFFDEQQPINDSPNNIGKKILPPAHPALIWYPSGPSTEFPLLGQGGSSAMTGPVYHYKNDPSFPDAFPKNFDRHLIIFDWMRSWIFAVELDTEGRYVSMAPLFQDQPFIKPIQVKFGPDGAMYVLDYGSNWYSDNPDAALVKINYQTGNRKPDAQIFAKATAAAAPASFQLSADPSTDLDKEQTMEFKWKLSTDTTFTQQGKTANFSFTVPGIYHLVLAATDSDGAMDTDTISVAVGNAPPAVVLNTDHHNSFFNKDMLLAYNVIVTDQEDGSNQYGSISDKEISTAIFNIDGGAASSLVTYSNEPVVHAISTQFYPGEILINESDCRACHAPDKASVGPSWQAIADAYPDEKSTVDTLIQKILKGGQGRWGDKQMTAHPQFTDSQASEMIRFILSQKSAISKPDTLSIPNQGSIKFTQMDRYEIRTTYTDHGINDVPAITTMTTTRFYPATLQPRQFDFYYRSVVGSDETITQKAIIGHNGGHLGLKKINLQDIEKATVKLRTDASFIKIEIRGGQPDGPLLSKAEKKLPPAKKPATMKDKTWMEYDLRIPKLSSKNQDLYFIFYSDKDQTRRVYHAICEVAEIRFSS